MNQYDCKNKIKELFQKPLPNSPHGIVNLLQRVNELHEHLIKNWYNYRGDQVLDARDLYKDLQAYDNLLDRQIKTEKLRKSAMKSEWKEF